MADNLNKESGEKLDGEDVNIEGTFLSKISNFWFCNKWKVIIGLFAILLVTVCTLQMCGNETEDITILYAGSCYVQTDHISEMKQAFSAVLPADFNGDGVKNVDIASCHVYSDEQVQQRKEEAEQDENVVEINTVVNQRDEELIIGTVSQLVAKRDKTDKAQ